MQSATPPDYKTLYEQSQLRIIALEQQLQQLQKMIFGSRHERFVPATSNDPQLSLDIQTESVGTRIITDTQKITYTRNKMKNAPNQLQAVTVQNSTLLSGTYSRSLNLLLQFTGCHCAF